MVDVAYNYYMKWNCNPALMTVLFSVERREAR